MSRWINMACTGFTLYSWLVSDFSPAGGDPRPSGKFGPDGLRGYLVYIPRDQFII